MSEQVSEQYGLIVRLPSGEERWYGTDAPHVGDVLAHLGREYLVVAVEPARTGQVVVTLDDVRPTRYPGSRFGDS